MRTGNCDRCRTPGKDNCTKICDRVTAEMDRITNGDMRLKKNQHRIEPIYEHQMGRTEHNNFTNMIYGAGVDD